MNKAEKIVIVSLHKTGTTTVSKFLEKLGFLVTGPDTHLYYEVDAKNFKNVAVFLERYDVFQDDPWYLLYPYILEKYPNSKFIFLERDAQSWLSSMQRFYGIEKYNNKVRRLFYGNANTLEYADSYLEKYRAHNTEVLNFFNGKNNIIYLNISNPNAALQLQKFLGLPIKYQEFEHLNKTPTNEQEEKKRKKRLYRKSYFGLNNIVKKMITTIFGYAAFIKIRDNIRFQRSKFRVFMHKIINR